MLTKSCLIYILTLVCLCYAVLPARYTLLDARPSIAPNNDHVGHNHSKRTAIGTNNLVVSKEREDIRRSDRRTPVDRKRMLGKPVMDHILHMKVDENEPDLQEPDQASDCRALVVRSNTPRAAERDTSIIVAFPWLFQDLPEPGVRGRPVLEKYLEITKKNGEEMVRKLKQNPNLKRLHHVGWRQEVIGFQIAYKDHSYVHYKGIRYTLAVWAVMIQPAKALVLDAQPGAYDWERDTSDAIINSGVLNAQGNNEKQPKLIEKDDKAQCVVPYVQGIDRRGESPILNIAHSHKRSDRMMSSGLSWT